MSSSCGCHGLDAATAKSHSFRRCDLVLVLHTADGARVLQGHMDAYRKVVPVLAKRGYWRLWLPVGWDHLQTSHHQWRVEFQPMLLGDIPGMIPGDTPQPGVHMIEATFADCPHQPRHIFWQP